jgi:hypothetical protein
MSRQATAQYAMGYLKLPDVKTGMMAYVYRCALCNKLIWED